MRSRRGSVRPERKRRGQPHFADAQFRNISHLGIEQVRDGSVNSLGSPRASLHTTLA